MLAVGFVGSAEILLLICWKACRHQGSGLGGFEVVQVIFVKVRF